MESKSLAGVRHCGCITAALSVRGGTDWGPSTTEKDVREFYVEMAKSGREVVWLDNEEIRARWGICPHEDEEEEIA
jgi:hypothetical protein